MIFNIKIQAIHYALQDPTELKQLHLKVFLQIVFSCIWCLSGPHMRRRGFWIKKLESLYGASNAQNLICIAKMAAMVFKPTDWLHPKNRLDDITSNKIRVLYGRRKIESYDWTMAALSK